MSLPADVVQGVTTGHLAHHGELHTAQGALPASVAAGSVGHLQHHAALRTWAAAASVIVPEVVDAASHELAHEGLHGWRNSLGSPVLTLTAESGSTLTTESGSALTTEQAA